MIIKTTYIKRMRTGETQTLATRVLKCLKPFDLPTLMLHDLNSRLESSTDLLSQVLVKYQHTDKTKALKLADEVRDDSFVAFRKSLAAVALRRDQEKAARANRLLDLIRQHGWDIHKMNYADESSHLVDLLQTIANSPEFSDDVAFLKHNDHLDELKLAQDEFETILLDRNQVTANELEANGGDAAKQVKEDCMMLFQAIDSLYAISKKPEYMQMANQINEIVDAQIQVIRARITRMADKEEDEVKK